MARVLTSAGRVGVSAGRVALPSPLVSFFTASYTGSRNDFTGPVGFEFTPSSNLLIRALGRSVSGSMLSNHPITVWRVSDQVALGSVTVTPSSPIDALGYKYERLVTNIALLSGVAYRIASEEVNGGDAWMNTLPVPSHTGAASINTAVWQSGGGYPANLGPINESYVPPNFYL